MVKIQKAGPEAVKTAARLALLLWPEHTLAELEEEFSRLISNPDAAVFLAFEEGREAGFAQCGLRRDYVEGASSSPVGYLEGIYVCPDFRGKGISRALLNRCEGWAREKGAAEFASDCPLTNAQSLSFHLKSGFEEAGRIICLIKPL